MRDWLDHLLVGSLFLTIGAGVVYAATLMPIGQQAIWGNAQQADAANRKEINECLILFDDMNSGRLLDVDFGKAEECKKKVGVQAQK